MTVPVVHLKDNEKIRDLLNSLQLNKKQKERSMNFENNARIPQSDFGIINFASLNT